jgi:Ca2+-binding RTX toxin-like protein/preprotein translocase subunit YajC
MSTPESASTGDITPNGILIENNSVNNIDGSDYDPLGVNFKPNPALTTAHDVDGSDGDDELSGGAGSDILSGLGGHDVLTGEAGDDELSGGGGDDLLYGGTGADTIEGGDGEDVLDGGDDDDSLTGNGGDDVIGGGEGSDILDGGAGSDVLDGGEGDDLIDGGAGSDVLDGGDGSDVLDGGEGDDVFTGGAGDDDISGGNGEDTATYAGPRADYTVTFTTGPDGRVISFASVQDNVTAGGDEGSDVLSSVEHLVFGDMTLDLEDPVQLFDDGGQLVGTFDTIQDAVDAASAGYTVNVSAGTYAEIVTVDEDVTIVGPNSGIAGDGTRVAEAVVDGFYMHSAGATLDGLTILGGGTIAGNPAGIYVDADDVTLTNLIVQGDGSAGTGILTPYNGGVSGLELSDSRIDDWTNGTYFNPTTQFTATGNSFDGNGVALTGDDWDAGTFISDNDFTNSSFGHVGYGVLDGFEDVGAYFGPDNSFDASGGRIGIFAYTGNQFVIGTGYDDYMADTVADSGAIFLGQGGDDYLDAGSGDDQLQGDTGDDIIIGGSGTDTAYYADPITAADLTLVADADPETAGDQQGWIVTTATEGTDRLVGIEIVDGIDSNVLLVGAGGFATIQEAIDAANSGDTILIAGGTYVEQLTIEDFSDLTIMAAPGETVIVKAPADLEANGYSESFGLDVRAVIAVNDSINITITGIEVDGSFAADTTDGGSDEFTGIGYFNSSGSVANVSIDDVGNSQGDASFGLSQGSGLFLDGGNTAGLEVSVTDSSITDFQKTGALIFGITVDFTGNTVTGIGGTALLAQNGLQIGNSQGVIDGNAITGFGYSGGFASATGIFAYEPTGPLSITNNDINGAGAAGSAVGLDLSDVQGISVVVSDNSFSNLDFGISAYTFLGGTVGLDTDPAIFGNAFAGILELGIYFAPEESILDDFSTTASFFQNGTQFDDYLAGSLGNDGFSGLGGDDILIGNGGDDQFEGNAGDDLIIGGDGIDTVYFADAITVADLTFVADADPETPGNQSGVLVATATEGTDSLVGVEIIAGLTSNILLVGDGGFATIQEAIDAANDGDTILVASGTYVEQLVIEDFADLTIMARPGATVVVQAPADLAVNGHSDSFGLDVRAVIAVNDSINITITGIDVDGNFAGDTTDGGSDEFTGIGYFNSSGSVDDVDIGNVGNSQGDAAFGLPQGSGLFIDGGNTAGLEVSVTDSSITDFQKNGAIIFGVTINFTGNTVTGIGGTDLLAQNGLQIGNSQGVIDGNTITGFGYSGGILSATGIFAYEPTGPLAITDNIVTGAGAAGSAVGLDLSDVQGIAVEVTGNSFSDLDFGISAYSFVGGTIGLDTDPLISGKDGNAGDDSFTGGTGDDLLDGGADTDTAYYSGNAVDYTITYVLDGGGNVIGYSSVVDNNAGDGDDGSDTLISIEKLVFADGPYVPNTKVHLYDASDNLVANYQTIQAAINAASDNYTIRVDAGTFTEDLVIDKGVRILGAQAGAAVGGRDAANGVGETTIVGHASVTAADNVTLDGIRFLNDGTTTAPNRVDPHRRRRHRPPRHRFDLLVDHGRRRQRRRRSRDLVSPVAAGLITITDNLISGTSHGQFGTASWGRGIWFDGGGVALVVSGNTIEWTRTGFNLDMSGTSTANISNNELPRARHRHRGRSRRGRADRHRQRRSSGSTRSSTSATSPPGHLRRRRGDRDADPVGDFNDPIVVLGGSGNDTFTGTAGVDVLDGNNSPTEPDAADNDVLNGLGGNDFLFGRGGNDTLDGGTGDDAMTGGTGNDIYVVDSVGDVVTEAASEGTDEVRTTLASYTLATDLENLTGLGALGQTLNGNASNNIIDGGLGADTMTGLTGNDTYVVDNVGDVVNENAGEGTDEIRTNLAAYSLAALVNIENLTGTNAAGQTLTGNGGANVITGAGGADTIDGGAGADTMAGGGGNDIYLVDNAGDSIVELAGEGTDEVRTGLATYSIAGFGQCRESDRDQRTSITISAAMRRQHHHRRQRQRLHPASGRRRRHRDPCRRQRRRPVRSDPDLGRQRRWRRRHRPGRHPGRLFGRNDARRQFRRVRVLRHPAGQRHPLRRPGHQLLRLQSHHQRGQCRGRRDDDGRRQPASAGEDFTFNGSAETDGAFFIYGGIPG